VARKESKRYFAPASARESAATGRKSGTLHVVATPIGNLADLSARAREILSGVAVILAEDTRHTAQLLAACGIATPLVSAHEHNESQRVPELLERLRAGEDVALVSDAGTPLVSDPGFRVVSAVAEAGFEVRAVPGACAAVAALSIAGLPSDRFRFEGFLPAKTGARRERLEALAAAPETLIFYEAPHRLRESLEEMAGALGAARRAVIARELTKLFETTYRGTLAELVERASADADMRRGEIVIVVEGAAARAADADEVRRVLGILLEQLPVRQAADLAAQLTHTAPNAAYKLALVLRAEK
jgi:16S rRNA (cytidine1402-2'-O)-methyltransferase